MYVVDNLDARLLFYSTRFPSDLACFSFFLSLVTCFTLLPRSPILVSVSLPLAIRLSFPLLIGFSANK